MMGFRIVLMEEEVSMYSKSVIEGRGKLGRGLGHLFMQWVGLQGREKLPYVKCYLSENELQM